MIWIYGLLWTWPVSSLSTLQARSVVFPLEYKKLPIFYLCSCNSALRCSHLLLQLLFETPLFGLPFLFLCHQASVTLSRKHTHWPLSFHFGQGSSFNSGFSAPLHFGKFCCQQLHVSLNGRLLCLTLVKLHYQQFHLDYSIKLDMWLNQEYIVSQLLGSNQGCYIGISAWL